MKRKTLMILLPSLVLVLALFLLPKWLLYRQQSTIDTRKSADLTAQLAASEEMDLMAKLQLLADSKVQTVQLEITDEQAQEAKTILKQEVETLHKLGYYAGGSIAIDELLSDKMSVVSMVYIDAQRVLRVYRIESVSATAIVDIQTHKILSIGSNIAAWERAEDALNVTSDNGKLQSMKTLEILAKYYGFALEHALVSSDYRGKDNGWAIVSGYFVNEASERVGFCLNFIINYEYIYWGAASEELMNAERAIEEAG